MGFREGKYLFQEHDLSHFLAEIRARMLAEIERLPSESIVRGNLEQLATSVAANYVCLPIALRRDALSFDHEEVELSIDEVPDGRLLAGLDDHEGATLSGTRYTWHIPFDGERELFFCAGSSWTTNPPCAEVGDREIVFARRAYQQDANKLKADFERAYEQTKRTLREINTRVEQFNAQLISDARAAIVARREKLGRADSIAAEMGYPLKRRADAPPTYSRSLPKRRPPISTPQAGNLPVAPEAVVAMADYEDILKVLESMALMLERSPHAFRLLKEEELRFFFLVYLNGQYDGSATGETFNFSGKTDILINDRGRSIFVAECKFWSGPSGFTATIDQLLGYLSWRDTKAAILVFNRDRQMSTVVGQVSGLLSAHRHYKAGLDQQGETRFRAIFRQPNDAEREVLVTVLVFDVPGAT
jgi:hypothetical protein